MCRETRPTSRTRSMPPWPDGRSLVLHWRCVCCVQGILVIPTPYSVIPVSHPRHSRVGGNPPCFSLRPCAFAFPHSPSPHPVISRPHPRHSYSSSRHSRVGGNPPSCVRRRIHWDTLAPARSLWVHSPDGSWKAHPDSRLRGNDGGSWEWRGGVAGNDGGACGHDAPPQACHVCRDRGLRE